MFKINVQIESDSNINENTELKLLKLNTFDFALNLDGKIKVNSANYNLNDLLSILGEFL